LWEFGTTVGGPKPGDIYRTDILGGAATAALAALADAAFYNAESALKRRLVRRL
jgi:hypothetical protein